VRTHGLWVTGNWRSEPRGNHMEFPAYFFSSAKIFMPKPKFIRHISTFHFHFPPPLHHYPTPKKSLSHYSILRDCSTPSPFPRPPIHRSLIFRPLIHACESVRRVPSNNSKKVTYLYLAPPLSPSDTSRRCCGSPCPMFWTIPNQLNVDNPHRLENLKRQKSLSR
jgi:hypothetical protein